MPFTPEDEADHDYTRLAAEYGPFKKLRGTEYRHVITRNSGVLMGMWGSNVRESLVVDNEEENQLYNGILSDVKIGLGISRPEDVTALGKKALFRGVSDVVTQILRYSLEEVEDIYHDLGGSPGVRVALSDYIERGVGVCRHQALLAAALIQMLQRENFIEGWSQVNRSQQWSKDGDVGGHAWARHIGVNGEIFIIDPTNDVVETLEDAMLRPNGWNYRLPEDKVREEIIREAGQLGIIGQSSPARQYNAMPRWYLALRKPKK